MSGHACGTHKVYRLTCEEYDGLLKRRDHSCWRCNHQTDRLHVDHDHALGMAAVRGMLCAPCNSHLGRVDAQDVPPDELDRAYLSSAWHRGRPTPYVPDGRTPARTFTADEALWDAAKRIADARRETLSAVMKRALVEYVEKHGGRIER